MLKDTEKVQEPCHNYTSRESCVSILRSKARRMREHSIHLDKLADSLGHLSDDAEEALWKELVSKQF